VYETEVEKDQRICHNCEMKGYIRRFCRKSRYDNNDRQPNRQNMGRKHIEFRNVAVERGTTSDTYYAFSPHVVTETAIVDSGCSQQMVATESNLFDVKDCTLTIKIADGNLMLSAKSGNLKYSQAGMEHDLILRDVLVVPKLEMMLVSMPTATNSSIVVTFERDVVFFAACGTTIAMGRRRGRVYEMELILYDESCMVARMESWHLRLGHPSDNKLMELWKFYPDKKFSPYGQCEACMVGKHRRNAFASLKNMRDK
jgi:GAG-pre-integrase domain